MEKELDNEIKATQATLGKYVKRPPLNEKLLKKPPFRFLHDIVTTVIKNNGFFEGLFDDEELISENVKDRDAKILFLTKLISVLNLATGKALSAKPSKIVAGQEPEKTNELLQCLGQALENNISTTEAVKRYKESLVQISKNEKKNKTQIAKNKNNDDNETKKKKESDKPLASRSRESLTNQKKEVTKAPKSSSKTSVSKLENKRDIQKKTGQSTKTLIETAKDEQRKSITKRSGETVSKQTSAETKDTESKNKELDTSRNKDNEDEKQIDNNKLENKIDNDVDNKVESEAKSSEESEVATEKATNITNNIERSVNSLEKLDAISSITTDKQKLNSELTSNKEQSISKKEIPEAGFVSEKSVEVSNDDSLKNDSVIFEKRVSEIDPDASRKNEKKSLLRPPSVRPSSSRPGAPRLKEKNEEILPPGPILMGKVNIIVENVPPDEDDENSLVIVDDGNYEGQENVESVDIPSAQHGHLVQQILDSQKGLSSSGKPEIEWEFGAQKARETANQEIEQMKVNIQAHSRVTNPLGKLLDHVQEDVEVMRQELQQWTKLYEETIAELAKKKIINEESFVPLHAKKKQLDADIEEKREKINDLKVVIQKNTTRINKLLANEYVQ